MPITIPTQAGLAYITGVAVSPVLLTATGECTKTTLTNASFFSLYGTDTDGHERVIQDYKTQHEADLAACVFRLLIQLQERKE